MARYPAVNSASRPHSPVVTGPGSSRPSIQIATPRNISPKIDFTVSIHAPAFALADHGERGDQRGRNAGRHDQRRERPHDGRADQ